jgi:hypothetical protein
MASNIAKAAVSALALNGGGETPDNQSNSNPLTPKTPENQGTALGEGTVPTCPNPPSAKFHFEDVCLTRPVRLNKGSLERGSIYDRLVNSGTGASLVPNQQTVTCPLEVQSLESPTSVKGFDTTWVVENTGTSPVVVAWVVDGIEWSPFEPDVKAIDDPKARVLPGDWLNVPTFDSFVYHVRELDEDGNVGNIVLQHRVGLVPVVNRNGVYCDASKPDVEPVDPITAMVKKEFSRNPTPEVRPCNTIDVGFRNQVGCPLHVYWANQLEGDNVPKEGFNCGENFRFHLGTKPAPQDFMNDWESSTKFEGSFIGHTFVMRLASDPNVVVDSYTIQTTKIIDCPNRKQKVAASSAEEAAVAVAVEEAVLTPEGNVLPFDEQAANEAIAGAATILADMGATSS